MVQDKYGVLLCPTRLGNTRLAEVTIMPTYLPKESRAAQLITMHFHVRAHHPGVLTTLARLRAEYWLPSGRRSVAGVINKECIQCVRFSAKAFLPPTMPDLPGSRVNKCRPFEILGSTTVDTSIWLMTVKKENTGRNLHLHGDQSHTSGSRFRLLSSSISTNFPAIYCQKRNSS
uniref:Integrase zinc-binding domain-containing protein n=1 Tax=Ditylenchus dipsaci TaxID=166011 RepID=A0A915D878_9BILA